MADTYFTDPYKKLYDVLKGSSIDKSAQAASEAAELVALTIKRLQLQISDAEWEELGYTELATVSTPALQNRVSTLNENVSNVLGKACTLSMNSLLPTLQLLYDADERYRAASAELGSLSEPDKEKEPDKHGEYVDTKTRLEEEISVLVTKTIPGLKAAADSKIDEIKSLNGNIETFAKDSSGNIVEIKYLTLTEKEREILASLSIIYDNGKTKIYEGGIEYGYARKVLTSHGMLVTVFQQGWNELLYFGDQESETENLRAGGCANNALAAILSAKYSYVTPEKIYEWADRKRLYAGTIKEIVEKNCPGVKVEYRGIYKSLEAEKAKIIQEIQRGNMAICTVQAGTGNKKKFNTDSTHWVSIIDYDEETDSFIISDSADQENANALPIDATEFLKYYEVNTNIVYLSDTSGYIGNDKYRVALNENGEIIIKNAEGEIINENA